MYKYIHAYKNKRKHQALQFNITSKYISIVLQRLHCLICKVGQFKLYIHTHTNTDINKQHCDGSKTLLAVLLLF